MLNEFRRALVTWTVAAPLFFGGDAAGAEEPSPLLHDDVRFQPSDAPRFADPAFDDSGWQTVRVDGERLESHWPFGCTVGWYRWRWRAPAEALASSPHFEGAFLFGSIGEADEVYVNGRRIGGLGSISRSYLLVPFQPRLYRVPPGTLRPDTENVIAVRVMRFLWTDDPITPPMLFGHIDPLRDSLETSQQIQRFIEGILTGSSVLSLIFWCFLIICGARDRSFVAFGPVLCCYGLAVFLDSRVCFDLGWRTSITERSLAVATMILPAAGVHFVSQFCLGRSPALFRWIFVLPSVLLSVLLAFASMFDGWVWFSVITAWHLLVAVAVLIALANVGTALWRGKQESWALMVGAVVGIAATAIELGGPGYNRLFGIAVGNYGFAFMLLCSILALALHYRRVRDQLRLTSAAALAAQEDERHRLARDLHDSVLQSLLALRLNLNMLHAREEQPTQKEQLAMLLDESAATIEELRRVAHDLRSADLERHGLAAALQQSLDRTAARLGITAETEIGSTQNIDARVADHLYRIAQEALHNVEKHAAATLLRLSFHETSEHYVLEVSDNGCGFEPEHDPPQHGLGMATIRERAVLLGGRAEIRSRPRHGTRITVQVPRP